jgi:sulfite oxidase
MGKARDVLSGIIAAVLALGIGQLAAAFVSPASAPVLAVGSWLIDLAPKWAKDWAIRNFGTNDKTFLVALVAVVLVVLAGASGVVARKNLRIGLFLFVALGIVGAWAAVDQSGASWLDALPSLLGAAAACYLLSKFMAISVEKEPTSLARRDFLRVAGLGIGVAAFAGLGGELLPNITQSAEKSRAKVVLPQAKVAAPEIPAAAELPVSGISPLLTPNSDFYRIDTSLTVPNISTDEWRLTIHGQVDKPIQLSYADLLKMDLTEHVSTLSCVSNEVGGDLIGTAKWLGVPLKTILRQAGIKAGADQLVSRSSSGDLTIGTPTGQVMDGRDALLAIAMNGEPLPLQHGFPVRMIVPGLYGYTSATKWVTDIEATTMNAYNAYWAQRGWAQQATVKTESRIDVPQSGASVSAGTVAVAGVAWATHRGISGVQVRVDSGAWQDATLAAEVGTDVWRQWKFAWIATSGTHQLQARAIDGSGDVQTGDLADPAPNGATGWHTITVSVK